MRTSDPGKEPGEDFNVREEHGQIWREYSEPFEKYQAIPWWIKHLIYAPLFIWALWYLIIYTGGFDTDEYYEGLDPVNYNPTVKNAPGPGSASNLVVASGPDGKAIYTNVCAACHQANGQGLPGVFPPLAGSDWVAGDDKVLSALVLHGLMGPITVNGTPYTGAMPPWKAALKDEEIAAVLTFVRSEWGNRAGVVKTETVSTIRNDHGERAPWTEADLKTTFSK
ncbi:MAG: mono/diheme cytochrome c family protein [Akkermansiaceae bacterium]|jgi:mono/diheme cytochrome c family protein